MGVYFSRTKSRIVSVDDGGGWLAGRMIPRGWSHRIEQHAVHLASSLLCTGCGLGP